jgi:hypothetical protein
MRLAAASGFLRASFTIAETILLSSLLTASLLVQQAVTSLTACLNAGSFGPGVRSMSGIPVLRDPRARVGFEQKPSVLPVHDRRGRSEQQPSAS